MSFVVKIVLLYLIYFLTIYQVGCDFRYKIMNKKKFQEKKVQNFFRKKDIFIFGALSKIINFASGGGGPSNMVGPYDIPLLKSIFILNNSLQKCSEILYG